MFCFEILKSIDYTVVPTVCLEKICLQSIVLLRNSDFIEKKNEYFDL